MVPYRLMPEIYGIHTKKTPQSATKHLFCSNPHFIFEKALGMDIEEAIRFSNELMNAAQYTSKMELHHLQHNAIMFLNTKQYFYISEITARTYHYEEYSHFK